MTFLLRKFCFIKLNNNNSITLLSKNVITFDSKNVFFSSKRSFHSTSPIHSLGKQRSKRLLPIEPVKEGSEKTFRRLWKPFCFTLFIGSASFAGCSILQYEVLRSRVKNNENWQFPNSSNSYGKAGSSRNSINQWWNDLMYGEKLVVGLISLNVLVFLAWKVPVLQKFMHSYFTSSPMASSTCLPMLLSVFSHYSAFHLFANMYVLWSFTPSVIKILGPEQFLATYLTAGVVSNFASYILKIACHSMTPSLGASGAIMAILGMVCLKNPDARLSIAFVDQIIPHSFTADMGMKSLILMDILGILFKWRLFDHAAHLGGMFFGLWYATYGHNQIWHRRESLMRKWHQLRTSKK